MSADHLGHGPSQIELASMSEADFVAEMAKVKLGT